MPRVSYYISVFFLDFLFVSKPTLWSVGPLNFVNSYFFCFLGRRRRRKEREKEKSFLLGMNSFKCRLKTRILTHDPFFAAVLSSHFFPTYTYGSWQNINGTIFLLPSKIHTQIGTRNRSCSSDEAAAQDKTQFRKKLSAGIGVALLVPRKKIYCWVSQGVQTQP